MIDLAVVGGGPVGLVTALAARRAGLRVTVFDKRRNPIDKACGEGLMPEGLAVLARLGVALPDGARFGGIRYVDGEVTAEGRFPDGVWGRGVRRLALHRRLAEAATAAGVETRWGTAVRGLVGGEIVTAEGRTGARWIAAADGLHSPTRSWAGMKSRPGPRRRFGVRRHFRVRPWTDCVEVHWGPQAEAYVTPVGEREVGVAMLWSGEKSRFDELLTRFPALGCRLEGAAATSRDRGAGPFWQRPSKVVAGNLALVGDAAGYLDAITGEGLALGFRQAELLVTGLVAGGLAGYERACRRLARAPFLMMRALLVAERRPWLRRRLVAALAADRDLFSTLLAAHVGEGYPTLGTALRLVKALAAA